ncbi:MAG: hypothetical protein Q7J84_12735 [Sulfuricaulis sp.]|nr:hypothetical protein [Sulfuricaulis sp.]
MLKHCLSRYARVAMFSVALMTATTAQASIVLPGGDIFLDGSFQGMTYGASGSANLAPLLYIGDLGGTLPPYDQIIGTGLDFSYGAPVFGSSSVTFTYRVTNKDFDSFNDLRFFLDLKTKGQASFQDTAAVVGFGAPTVPGAADHFQIFDFNAAGNKPLEQIASSSNLNDNTAAACGTGCFSDLALQWNRPELLVGDTWEIKTTLVDDPSLVAGGRYLLASSLGADGTQIIFGSPTPVPLPPALLLLGSGLAWLFAFRRRRA